MKRLLATIALLSAFVSGVPGQENDHIFEIKVGKKVINVSELGMPDNTTVQEALEVMPEMLGRDLYEILENYDVQYNDKSLLVGAESALEQIHLGDVKEIEISKSPSASAQKRGQGGVINIIPKDDVEGFSGKVILDASTQWDVMPNFQFSYHKDKFTVSGWLTMEYYHPQNDYEFSRVTGDRVSRFIADTSGNDYGHHNVRVFVEYKPTGSDILKFWLTEGLSNDNKTTLETTTDYGVLSSIIEKGSRDRKFELSANAEYKHVFAGKSEAVAELNYSYSPTRSYAYNGADEDNGDSRPSNIEGLVKYKHVFRTVEGNKSLLTGGLNYSYAYNYEYFDDLSTHGMTLYLSPYLEYEGKFGNWNMIYSVRYQHNKYGVQEGEESVFVKPMNDITGDIKIGWQFRPHQNLRLNLQRTVSKPGYYQIYPYFVYRPQQGGFVLGNENLGTVPTYSAGINYIFDHDFSKSTLVMDFGVDYRHSEGVISSQSLLNSGTGTSITYVNSGVLRNFCLDMMAFYKYSNFSVGFTANAFSNFEAWSDLRSQYGYFNLSLTPAFDFSANWNLSGRLTYYSRVETGDSILGDAFDGRIRLTKLWKNIDAHVEFSDIFHDMTKDVIYGDKMTTVRYYDLIKRAFEIGVTVKF